MTAERSANAPYLVDGCSDCGHVKRIHLGNVGRCIVTGCTCSTYDPPIDQLQQAMEDGQWP